MSDLAMLTMSYKWKGVPKRVKALFNPTQLSFSKKVTWQQVKPIQQSQTTNQPPKLELHAVESETLTVNLFFDTYAGDPHPSDLDTTLSAFAGPAVNLVNWLMGPQSVVKLTDEVMALSQVEQETHSPPQCTLSWGAGWTGGQLFRGVLSSVTRTYTLFHENGTPLRATMDCTFTEVPKDFGGALNSADVAKQHTVLPGDTLMLIASIHYGDQSLWRRIAEANNIDDPRRLTPGRVLSIPKIV